MHDQENMLEEAVVGAAQTRSVRARKSAGKPPVSGSVDGVAESVATLKAQLQRVTAERDELATAIRSSAADIGIDPHPEHLTVQQLVLLCGLLGERIDHEAVETAVAMTAGMDHGERQALMERLEALGLGLTMFVRQVSRWAVLANQVRKAVLRSPDFRDTHLPAQWRSEVDCLFGRALCQQLLALRAGRLDEPGKTLAPIVYRFLARDGRALAATKAEVARLTGVDERFAVVS